MAGKPNKPGQMAVTVAMNPGAADYVEKNANGGDASLLLGQWATFWLDSQARGGVMISPEDHNYLATLNNGVKFSSGKQLVAAVERGLKRDDGQFTFPITIDPAYIQPLTEFAEMQGRTVEELVQDAFATVMGNGWLYTLTPVDGAIIPLTARTMAVVRDSCKKANVNSEDLAAMLADGRFTPFSTDDLKFVGELAGKNSVDTVDFMSLMRELAAFRESAAQ